MLPALPVCAKGTFPNMGFYNDILLPRLCDMAMRHRELLPYRARVIAAARGRVLEIGIGSGLNLPFYGPDVTGILGVEPAPRLLAMARRAPRPDIPLALIKAGAEAIPIDDHAIDTVVTTWSMCSIAQIDRAVSEARRVLKVGGKLLFVEHGRAFEPGTCAWQDRLNPLWKRLSGGCHLNRDIGDILSRNGFHIETMNTGYMNAMKPLSFLYEGQARPR